MGYASSQERTRNYISQIKGSFVFKGLAIMASLFSVPLMIHYLGQEQYGVWATLLSIMSWVVFFDLGIGSGLRNKFAESLAVGETDTASGYLSTAYSLIGLVSLGMFIILLIASFLIPWQKFFNTQAVSEQILQYAVIVTGFFVCINFWLGLINQVLNALQKTSLVVFGQFVMNILALLAVIVLIRTTSASILYLACGYGFALVFSNILISLWFYRKRRDLIPCLSLVRGYVRPLLSFGLQFFVIQLAVLVIFTIDKILITQLFGPVHVTEYDVIYKMFGVITVIHSLVTAPLWSAYTEAYHRGDIAWIKDTLNRQLQVFGLIVLLVIVMVFMSRFIVHLWIGDGFKVSMALVLSVSAFVVVSTWNNVFAFLVNGIGAIKIQLVTAVSAAIINVPLSIFFVKSLGAGVDGIVWSSCICLMFFAIAGPLQVRMLLRR